MSAVRTFACGLTAIALAVAGGVGAAAANTCKLAKVAEWPVRLKQGKVIVDGAINGHKIGIMLDTGAERSLVLRSSAVRLGLTLQEVKGIRFFGVGGETAVFAARVEEFKVGETVRKDWLVITAGERDLGADIDFVLGEDFFSQVEVEFDLAHNAVRLFVPRDCGSSPLAYWATDGASGVEFENSAAARYKIILTVKVNGQPVEALLDSGAGISVLNKSDAARAGITPESPGVVAVGSGGGLGSKTVGFWSSPFASVAIGDEAIKDTTILFADLWKDATVTETGSHMPTKMPGMPGMLLGVDFLRSHRVLISHSQHRMYFTYAGGPVFSAGVPAAAQGNAEAPAAAAGASGAKTPGTK